MNFEKDHRLKKAGEKVGYAFSFILFAVIVSFVLFFLDRTESVEYTYGAGISAAIMVVGTGLKRWLR